MTAQNGNTTSSMGHYRAIKMFPADQRTDLAELHGNDPVDLQTQGERQRRTGCLLAPDSRLRPWSAYPSHDSDDEVVEHGPQHHRASVGVVAQKLPRSISEEHGCDHSENHQGVSQADDHQYLPARKQTNGHFTESSSGSLKIVFEGCDKNNTHHGRDTDKNQGAAQVGVLVFLRLAVGIVHNLQDQFLLQVHVVIKKERKTTLAEPVSDQ